MLPALIRRFHEARESAADTVTLWGSGTPRREFLHVDDCARACLHLMLHYNEPGPINIGVGEDIPIADLARLVARVVGFDGEIAFDTSMPDGMPRKLVDTRRINALGWTATIGLEDGIRRTYDWYRDNVDAARGA